MSMGHVQDFSDEQYYFILASSLVYSGSAVRLTLRHGFRRSVWHLWIKERISLQSIVGAAWFQSVLARALVATGITQKQDGASNYAPGVGRSCTCYITMSDDL
jgi:hypothetical protein